MKENIKMNTIDNLKWRYATQKFNPHKQVSDDKIQILKEAFNLTPTSYGMQPVRMIVVHNKEVQKKLYEYTYYQEQIITASHILVLCTETTIDDQLILNTFRLEKEIRNTPDEIIERSKKFRLELFGNWSEKQKEKWAVNQLYLTLGNILSACANECIDACPMEGLETDKYDTYLGLTEKGLKSHLVVPIGYRAEDDIFAGFKKVRRPLKEVIIDIE